MTKIFCDTCKKEILAETHAVISFPKEIDRSSSLVFKWYNESDICNECMIKIADIFKIKMNNSGGNDGKLST